MIRRLSILSIAFMLFSTACSPGHNLATSRSNDLAAAICPLPDLPRTVSDVAQVNGSDHLISGPGVTDNPPAAELDATAIYLSWAVYGYAKPENATLNSVTVDVESVTGDFWVGISDYQGSGSWDFYGPYTDDATVLVEGDPGQYVNETGNFNWVVAATSGSSLTLASSTIDYTGIVLPIYHVPPTGLEDVVPAPAADPSLVIMNDHEGVAEDGAPVVFYSADDGGQSNTFIGWYDGSAWESRELFAGERWTNVRAWWTGEAGLVVGYYHGEGAPEDPSEFLVVHTDAFFNPTTTESLGGAVDINPSFMDADYCAEADTLALIATYPAVPDSFVEVYKYPEGGDPQVDDDVFGNTILGCSVALSPDGSDGWGMYTSGTADTSETIILDYQMRSARFDGTDWAWDLSGYVDHNEPVAVDLHYTAAGDPEILLISARDLHIYVPFIIDLTATLYYDVVLGTYDGGWSYETLHQSDIDLGDIFNSNLGVDLGANVSWAAEDALHFANVDGTVSFTTTPEFAITGGLLTNHSNYMVGTGGNYEDNAYFTGAPGITHAWAAGPGGPACAYLHVEEADIDALLSGGVGDVEADLVYWSPE